MKKIKSYIGIACMVCLVSCMPNASNQVQSLTLNNSSSADFNGVVNLQADSLLAQKGSAVVIKAGQTILPSQWSDTDGDGTVDVLSIETHLKAGDAQSLTLISSSELAKQVTVKKTQAELWHKTTGKFKDGKYVGGGNFSRFDSLRVPDGFTDHAYFIKYEGPGWESDKVGYRLYLDWRNAIDVFGKRTAEPVLHQVGLDGYESYHHLQDWGMDVLKVGKSLGIGSTAWWDGEKAIRVEQTDSVSCKILSDDNLRSQVRIWYNGWQLQDEKVNIISLKSIDAGSRMTREYLSFNKPVANICTGIRKEPDTEKISLISAAQQWGCLATWGAQSLNNDQLGLAIIYPLLYETKITEDEHSHVVVFQKASKNVEYYFLAAWELEQNGITSREAFVSYLDEQLTLLEQPVTCIY
ncbi:DUF4861 domain-containing protein [Carboxylicivirga sp. A043]|uniref:DUF4861 domain-containing protein n=1 Tax=Carboxylicivirga litoralis TaxID=2816963 RepID=UPI0021CB95E9|nr:DUF4861 domain-containing protein [Carboxylicivirga sp. A043]MCU4158018.1 DUF4861 domain-containing protein [Carboxylicivirga sp. A043]